MKKVFVSLLSIALCLAFIVPSFAQAIESWANVAVGDADGDRRITAADARLVLRYSIAAEKPGVGTAEESTEYEIDSLPEDVSEVLDVNADKAVDTADSREILRGALGLKESTAPKAEPGTVTVDAGMGQAQANTYASLLGTTNAKIVETFNKYRDEYLSTQYIGSADWGFENFTTLGYGFNCAAFVADVMLRSASPEGVERIKYGVASCSPSSGTRYASAYSWYRYGLNNGLLYYDFGSIREALNSGKMLKGDIVFFKPLDGGDTHLGIFWGDNPYDNKFLHCGGMKYGETYYEGMTRGVHITTIFTYLSYYRMIVFHSPPASAGNLEIHALDTDGNPLPGAQFTLSGQGKTLEVGPTKADGKIVVKNLAEGGYNVTQNTYWQGYRACGANSGPVNVGTGTSKITFRNEPIPPGGAEVNVVVRDEFNNRLADTDGIVLTLQSDKYLGDLYLGKYNAEKKEFSFGTVLPGTYTLRVAGKGEFFEGDASSVKVTVPKSGIVNTKVVCARYAWTK